MLTKTFASIKPPPPAPTPSHQPISTFGIDHMKAAQKATLRKISIQEWWRRNAQIRKLWRESNLYKNQHYYPLDELNKEKYGLCKVEELYENYLQVPLTEEWPDDDEPYIVTISSEKIEGLILCTPDWLNKTKVVPTQC